MSERALGQMLYALLEHERNGAVIATGAVSDPVTLERVVQHPPAPLQTLLNAHVTALLATWPGGAVLAPAHLPAAAFWVAAAMNNLVRATTHPSKRLCSITRRLVAAIPPAATREAALAYHSLLRHLEHLPRPHDDNWEPVVAGLRRCSPLTGAWLPHRDSDYPWPHLLDLLREPALYAALRDRWLSLLPPPDCIARHGVPTHLARANTELSHVLDGLSEHGGAAGTRWLLELYEADCLLHRQGREESPTWPLLRWLHAARFSTDPLERGNARRVLARYYPLLPLIDQEHPLRPYTRLDGRFLESLGLLLVKEKRLRLKKVMSDE